jgi:hypothetical protein
MTIIKILANTVTITSNTTVGKARLVCVSNIGSNIALITLSDPVADVQIGNYNLGAGNEVYLQKAPGHFLSSNSAASVVGVAVGYAN